MFPEESSQSENIRHQPFAAPESPYSSVQVNLKTLSQIFGFTLEDAHLNTQGLLSSQQKQDHVARGIIISGLILFFSTCFVLLYVFLLFGSDDSATQSAQGFYDSLWVVSALLYAASLAVSVPILVQHLRPKVKFVTGILYVPADRRMLEVQNRFFVVSEYQHSQVRKMSKDIPCHFYYFESMLGRRLLSVVPVDEPI